MRTATTPMPTDHQIARDALDRLPLTATLEQMSDELALLAALRKASAAADAGRVVPHEEVERRSVELTRRIAAHDADPSRVLTWEQVEASVRRAR